MSDLIQRGRFAMNALLGLSVLLMWFAYNGNTGIEEQAREAVDALNEFAERLEDSDNAVPAELDLRSRNFPEITLGDIARGWRYHAPLLGLADLGAEDAASESERRIDSLFEDRRESEDRVDQQVQERMEQFANDGREGISEEALRDAIEGGEALAAVIVWSQARQAQSIVEFVRLTRDITPELTIEDAEAEMETRISLPFVETEVGGDLAFFGLSLSVLLLNMYLLSVLETIGVLMPNASADDLVGWICFLNVKRLRGLIVLTLRPAPAENGMSATHPYIFRPAVPAVDDEDE